MKKATKTPAAPPADLDEAAWQAAKAEINNADIGRFVAFVLGDGPPTSARQRKLMQKTVMKFAVLGWQAYAMK